MFEIRERQDVNLCKELARQFGLEYGIGDRAYVLYEDGACGMGVMGLENGCVVIKGVFANTYQYKDILLRALLNVIVDFKPIMVKVKEVNTYYKQFGFKEKKDYMEMLNTDIVFDFNCKNEK